MFEKINWIRIWDLNLEFKIWENKHEIGKLTINWIKRE